MNRDVEVNTFAKIHSRVILVVLALAASILLNVVTTHRANALVLDLVRETTKPLTQVLDQSDARRQSRQSSSSSSQKTPKNSSRSGSTSTSANQPPASTPSQSGQSEATASAPASAASQSPVNVKPLKPVNALMPAYSPVSNPLSSSAVLSQATAASIRAPAASNSALLQVSDQGWKVFGVLWYWWLGGTMLGLAAIRVAWKTDWKHKFRRRNVRVA